MRRTVLTLGVLLALGCPAGTGKHGPAEAAKGAAKGEAGRDGGGVAAAPEQKPTEPNTAEAPTKPAPEIEVAGGVDASKLGAVLEGAPLPITSVLGKAPAVVEPLIGEPTGKGLSRTSCVRYVPDRVWFECVYAYQRYEDKTGKFEAIQVTYEDGLATGIGFEGPKGEGDFDPRAALTFVGLALPGEPTLQKPEDNVQLWSWFNASARLLVEGKQYRVSVSSVEEKWDTALVEVFLNHPLTAEQQAKVKPSGE